MKKLCLTLILLLSTTLAFAEMSGDEIVREVDDKMDRTGSLSKLEMKVYRNNKLRKTYEMLMKSEGDEKILIDFLYPPRNKGEKYLKVDDSMWIYRPKINKVIRISGRSSFSGSDFSNTDILSVRLDKDYYSKLLGTEQYKEVEAYKLELTARSEEVTYAKIIYWVDKEKLIPLKRDFYTISGHLLKTLVLERQSDLFDEMPDTFIMSSVLEKDKTSVMKFLNYKGNQSFPVETFRQSSLKKNR
ncbi:outer membrane lipoprotein-sorting protein [bacterium]|nr:outer membrane lipoprotein-sorting protein [bacterium]